MEIVLSIIIECGSHVLGAHVESKELSGAIPPPSPPSPAPTTGAGEQTPPIRLPHHALLTTEQSCQPQIMLFMADKYLLVFSFSFLKMLQFVAKTKTLKASEMVQQVKALAAKPGDMSSVPRTFTRWEGEHQLLEVVLWLP